jgi:hypothetical protein
MWAKTINTRLPLSNPIMWQFEKVKVPPKLFFLTLFWESAMFFHQLSTSFHYSTAKQFHYGLKKNDGTPCIYRVSGQLWNNFVKYNLIFFAIWIYVVKFYVIYIFFLIKIKNCFINSKLKKKKFNVQKKLFVIKIIFSDWMTGTPLNMNVNDR